MAVYDSAAVYLETATSLQDKITKIDAIIAALMDIAITSAAGDNITEYSLDNGQTKIKTVYRGTSAILNSIKNYEAIKSMYINRLNGRVVRLVDSKNFNRNRNGRF